MKTKPEFKFGDRVVFIRDIRKQGVVSNVVRFAGLWWIELEGQPDWRYQPGYLGARLSALVQRAPLFSDPRQRQNRSLTP
jgi:hypothetical protein